MGGKVKWLLVGGAKKRGFGQWYVYSYCVALQDGLNAYQAELERENAPAGNG
jgi:hypothetical protein